MDNEQWRGALNYLRRAVKILSGYDVITDNIINDMMTEHDPDIDFVEYVLAKLASYGFKTDIKTRDMRPLSEK